MISNMGNETYNCLIWDQIKQFSITLL